MPGGQRSRVASVSAQAVQPDCWSAQPGLGRGGSSHAADGDACGTSESGQEAAGQPRDLGCGGPQQGHVSQTGDALEEAPAQRALDVFTERSLAQEHYVALWMEATFLQGTPFVFCMGATTIEGRNGLYGVDAAQ